MSREPGPREKALREQREARYAERGRLYAKEQRNANVNTNEIAAGIRRAATEGKAALEKSVAEAAKKRGRPRTKK